MYLKIKKSSMVKVGIIGGSGLDDPQIIKDATETHADTPYGKPASPLTIGKINGTDVVLIGRHGRRHEYGPSEVNYRANVYALKQQGVTHILATTACGSLREEIGRGHFVIIDQFIDFTKNRKNTYHDSFENGIAHAAMAEPFDCFLREALYNTAKEAGYPVHKTGTVITIEGPRFSTIAESKMFRMWGADIINMSIATEASLANELKIPYAAIAMSTDYDCWKKDEKPVSWEEILKVFHKNADNVKNILINVLLKIK
jgi:5'-methylthioadenosine phosphorylase